MKDKLKQIISKHIIGLSDEKLDNLISDIISEIIKMLIN